MRRCLPFLLHFTLGFLCLRQSAVAGVVEDWNEAFVRAIQRETQHPGLAARNLALLHLAIEGAGDSEPARAAAALEMGLGLFPSQAPTWEALRGKAGALDGREEETARAQARTLLQRRAADGAATDLPYIPNDRPGQWRRTAPAFRPPDAPQWRLVSPFAVANLTTLLPPPPPALGSPAYRAAWLEVRDLGRATSPLRTADQTLAARFWSDFSYTSTPPGHWNQITRDLVKRKGLSAAESARLFTRLNLALADAGIACWATKYTHNAWRPETAIHRAAEDGDAQTQPDATWKPLLPCPPHPDYVSGHSTFSGAAARVLELHFGTPDLELRATSDTVPGVTRSFTNVWACAQEISDSRVWGGIHFRFACEEGLALGKRVADAAFRGKIDPPP